MAPTATPDLARAAEVIILTDGVVGKGVRQLASTGGPDVQQQLAYDIAHSASAVEMARSMLDYGAKGNVEGLLTCAFVADMLHDVMSRFVGREQQWGLATNPLGDAYDFLVKFRDPQFVASLATMQGPRHLEDEFEMVQDSFRSFATNEIAPRAEHVHRFNEDVPEEIILSLIHI